MPGQRRVVFAGTPEFAAYALTAIIGAGHDIAQVLTQPDRASGRGMKPQTSAIKQLAAQHGIAVYQPERLKDPASHESIRAAKPDVMVVSAYGLILPQAVLDIPTYGCLNIHASLLPRWRGAAPIQRAIEAGDGETGITIMQMDAGLDTGPMLLRKALLIAATDTASSLHDKLAALGAAMIVETLEQLGRLSPELQASDGITYAHKIKKSEAMIDWQDDAETLSRRIRAFDPFPGMTAAIRNTPIKIWQAQADGDSGEPGAVLRVDGGGVLVACGQGAVFVTQLQKSGGKRLPAVEFLRGFPLHAGDRFDLPPD